MYSKVFYKRPKPKPKTESMMIFLCIIASFSSMTAAVVSVLMVMLFPTPYCNTNANTCNAAFSSYMSETQALATKLLAENDTIVFDQTVSNWDDAYSTTTGKYTVKCTGMYTFTWTICGDAKKYAGGQLGEWGTYLMQGTIIIGAVHTDTEEWSDHDCSTGSVTRYVFSGDEIYLKTGFYHQGVLLSMKDQSRTTFSGWKIFE
ncbi:complement C1q-like protein 2 [Mytilus trossulus]|uniref:complement C1q-like protein 2 n=1 Tax=Mytilus trossulus TaxID=6551 RepID=UPI0030060CDC